MRLTLFATPKPFRGHVGVIQRNAIRSWTRLRPPCQLVLLGDDVGTSDMARECGAEHLPEVARNEFGTPLLPSVFAAAERVAIHDVLCYVNADIILMSDFIGAVGRVAAWSRRFLMIGQRWDVDIVQPWDFNDPSWEVTLRSYVSTRGSFRDPYGPDYFVFPSGLWQSMPQFAVGRFFWDYWLIFQARSLGVPVVDATSCVMAIHQTHDYSHASIGTNGVWTPEAQRNLALAGGAEKFFTVGDSSHILRSRNVVPEPAEDLSAKRAYYRSRILARLGVDYYIAADVGRAWKIWAEAVRIDPSVLRTSLLLLMGKSLLGPRLLRWLRRMRGRHTPRPLTAAEAGDASP